MLYHCVHIGHIHLRVYVLKIPLKTVALKPLPQLASITDVTEVHSAQVRKTVVKVVLIVVSPHLRSKTVIVVDTTENARF